MSNRGKKPGRPPADDDVLYLDADESAGDESLDDILKQAQDSADRLAEKQRQGKTGPESAPPEPAPGSEELIEEIVLDETGAAPPPAPETSGTVATLRSQLAELTAESERLRAENAELKDGIQRRQAEFENFRKRMERDKAEFQKYAHSGLLKEVLPVLDNLERALMVGNAADVQSLRQGVELVSKQLRDALGRFGLKEIVSIGQEFDPNFHEAVASEPSSELPPNTVMSELQKGYMHHDRLLRAACVKVATASEGGSRSGTGTGTGN